MTTTTGAGTPPEVDDREPTTVSGKISTSFSGSALQKVMHGADLTGLPPQSFVRDAVRLAVEVAEFRQRGYKVFVRDERGIEYVLPLRF
ncbi:hypothetical protein [Knoellia aerolata]|nr:hypothetical protein [Knoellia aerolata]